ncbi:hypothetical protein Hypma_008545 [Hypsizygus marmoreus]|uniref:G domain-containing protein n=1 Tax=Hypsizygus marmoreus TaxID=39966 RepID=A0A369JXH6_HYPMA|nr:hypothetical protein Hypma_008545 [Hypsizygus marmoreus]
MFVIRTLHANGGQIVPKLTRQSSSTREYCGALYPWHMINEVIVNVGDRYTTHNPLSLELQCRQGKIELVVGLSTSDEVNVASKATENPDLLLPVTDEILRICPWFRILVIGKTGVGKSTLINETFGVTNATVSHNARGDADIDEEIFSSTNDKFVLHDSRGFEPGEEHNVEIVQDFINQRSRQRDVKDKLHAVWLCFEIPTSGSRLFESGSERFLKMKINGELGDVPIIAVFTKFDELVSSEKYDIAKDPSTREGLSGDAITELATEKAAARVQEECIKPFEEWVKGKVPHVTVSADPNYRDTLLKLIEVTYTNVYKYIQEASIVTAMAQKVNPDVNIDASIQVGKRKYWTGLASSMSFSGKSLKACLAVIHTDIIAVWHFQDPNMHLGSDEFRAMISNVVDATFDNKPGHAHKYLVSGLGLVGAIGGIISALAGPAAPIVVPIGIGIVLAVWAHQVYKESADTLRRLMTYIIDLTLIIQLLFWIQFVLNVQDRPLSRRLVTLAVKGYLSSPGFNSIHSQIREFADSVNLLDRMGPDMTFNKVVELINSLRMSSDSEAVRELERSLVGKFDTTVVEDEQWIFPDNVSYS